jgi:hypothetical protein
MELIGMEVSKTQQLLLLPQLWSLLFSPLLPLLFPLRSSLSLLSALMSLSLYEEGGG